MSKQALETFVILDKQLRTVRRLEVSAQLQKEITALFLDQEEGFLGNPSARHILPFDPGYVPDVDELQEVTGFVDEFDLHGAVKSPLGVPYFDEQADDIEQIRAVVTGYIDGSESRILIQNFDRRRVISPGGFSILRRGKTFQRMGESGLTLDKRISCIMVDDRLIFRSFHNARLIFDMARYFDEATDLQTANFFGFKSATDPAATTIMSMADSWVRKKVAMLSRGGPVDVKKLSKLTSAATSFKVPLVITGKGKNQRIEFPTNKSDLKKVLRFIDEDFYESLVTPGNRYYSNSKRKV